MGYAPRLSQTKLRACACALGLTWLSGLSAATAGSQLSLIVGQSAIIRLDANPSTGFIWVVDPATQNAGALSIENLGIERPGSWESGPGLIGRPGTQRWRITAKLPSKSIIVFSYVRGWENKPPSRQQVYEVDIRDH